MTSSPAPELFTICIVDEENVPFEEHLHFHDNNVTFKNLLGRAKLCWQQAARISNSAWINEID